MNIHRIRVLTTVLLVAGSFACKSRNVSDENSLAKAEMAGASRLDYLEDWKPEVTPQRDQGQLGTCHAFALLPGLDFQENTTISMGSKAINFNTAENWIVFVATLAKICDPDRQGDVRINQGGDPLQNLEFIESMGYCEEGMFSAYDKTDHQKSLSATNSLDALFQEFSRASYSKAAYSPELQSRFEDSFGISVDDARTLCPETGRHEAVQRLVTRLKYGRRLVSPDVTAKQAGFMACAQQAEKKRIQMANWGCRIESKEFSLDDAPPSADQIDERVAALKAELRRANGPMTVSMRNYPNGTPRTDKHGYHAFNLIGYDDEAREFLVRNSWGASGNMPVPYDAATNIYHAVFLDCPGKPNPVTPRERITSSPSSPSRRSNQGFDPF